MRVSYDVKAHNKDRKVHIDRASNPLLVIALTAFIVAATSHFETLDLYA